eukprot:gene20295-22282_t
MKLFRKCNFLGKIFDFAVIVACILCFQAKDVIGTGSFELQLVAIQNVAGELRNGSCCDGSHSIYFNSKRCLNPCDTYFKICVKRYESSRTNSGACRFGTRTTSVLGGNSFNIDIINKNSTTSIFHNTTTNPIVLPFTFSWMITYALIIDVMDKDDGDQSDREMIIMVTISAIVTVIKFAFLVGVDHIAILLYAKQVVIPTMVIAINQESADVKMVGKEIYVINVRRIQIAFMAFVQLHGNVIICKYVAISHVEMEVPVLTQTLVIIHATACLGSVERIAKEKRTSVHLILACTTQHASTDKMDTNAYVLLDLTVSDVKIILMTALVFRVNMVELVMIKSTDFPVVARKGGKEFDAKEVHVDECLSSPCVNSLSCSDLVNDYACHCKPGWKGKNCNEDIVDCQGQCEHGAQCQDLENDYRCVCPVGFSGRNCQINVNDCQSNPCMNNGVCLDKVSAYQCVCQTGFYGNRCQYHTDECQPNPCIHGVCTDLSHDYRCDCQVNWAGELCDRNYNDCLPNICQNGGTCIDRVDGYKCQCKPGYTGVNCTYNIDECANVNCRNGGSCMDLINGFNCKCRHGFSGRYCEIQERFCLSQPCRNNGTCIERLETYNCNCKKGFAGKHCDIDKDECSSSPCLNGGTCANLIGRFNCKCPKGFTGARCQIPINSCATFVCVNGGTCLNQQSGPKCICKPGYYGTNCQTDTNECASHPCLNGGKCLDQENQFICQCPSGTRGKFCELVTNSCSRVLYGNSTRVINTGVCGKHGTCKVLVQGGFHCTCDPGWTGQRCETSISHCDGNPCNNGGKCVDTGSSFHCECFSKWKGRTCNEPADICQPSPCKNGAVCLNNGGTLSCSCPEGFEGIYCEKDKDNCAQNPCFNGGKCIDGPNWYQCKCPAGFAGVDCRININECSSSPCTSGVGAKCVDGINKYTCVCPEGRTGKKCETVIQNAKCLVGDVFMAHNRTWQEECNTCTCENKKVTCTKVWCGPSNCLDPKNSNICPSNHPCKKKSDRICLTPPCVDWGQCDGKFASMNQGSCTPSTEMSKLTDDCAKVNIVYDARKMPKGTMLEDFCHNLRYMPLFRAYAKTGSLKIQCDGATITGNSTKSSITVSIKSDGTNLAPKAALELANYVRNSPTNSTMYNVFIAVVQITVERPLILSYHATKGAGFLIPLVACLVAFAALLLVILCITTRRHRNKEIEHTEQTRDKEESGYFAKTRNNWQRKRRDKNVCRKSKNILNKSTRTTNTPTELTDLGPEISSSSNSSCSSPEPYEESNESNDNRIVASVRAAKYVQQQIEESLRQEQQGQQENDHEDDDIDQINQLEITI